MKLWIARDKAGDLGLYGDKPQLSSCNTTWDKFYCNFIALDSNEYPEVTFENSSMEVELVIKK